MDILNHSLVGVCRIEIVHFSLEITKLRMIQSKIRDFGTSSDCFQQCLGIICTKKFFLLDQDYWFLFSGKRVSVDMKENILMA